jgi:beta-phosphoglucomutase-like phosphatase (HAD superfamily)
MTSAFTIERTWAELARTPVVVFDLDGTLIDSRQAILDCWADALHTTQAFFAGASSRAPTSP